MSKMLPLILALSVVLSAVACAEEDTAVAKTVALGGKVPDFTISDVAGTPFSLRGAAIDRSAAEAAVMKAAAAFGAAADADAKTPIASLAGVKDEDGELDASKRRDLAVAAGSAFGLIATEDSAERFQTLGDLTAWIAAAKDSPILFVAWSPNCPSVKKQNDKTVELAAATNVRIFALASNARDTDEHYAKFREAFDWPVRIFPDRDQRVTDLLGGKVTPHFVLLDKDGVMRYRGAIDNDPMEYMEDDEREDWLVDAIEAVRQGKAVEKTETEPSG
jgi:thiol-disulfide isomerase/thioredoxin